MHERREGVRERATLGHVDLLLVLFPGAACGREALKLPAKTAHSEGFEEDWRRRGAWRGAAEAHSLPIL